MVLSSSNIVLIGPLFNLVSSYQKEELKAIARFKDLQTKHYFYGWFVNTRTMIVITSLTDDQYYLWFLATQQGMPVSSGIPSTSFGRNFCLNILVLKGYQIFSEKLPHSFTWGGLIIARWTKLRFAMVPFTVFLEPFSECMLAGALASLSSYILFRFLSLSRYWITPC